MSIYERILSFALDLWDRYKSRPVNSAEPDAIPGDVRQSVSAGEAARRASHGPFKQS